MIFRFKIILSVASHKRKNSIFYEKNLKLTKTNTFNNVFVIEFSLTITFKEFLKKDWIFMNRCII